MKKFLSIALALLMVCVMLPVTALAAEPSGSIQGAIINHAAVSVELQDITFTESIAVKLYSGNTLLTTATLNTGKLETGSHDFVTCCIPTEGEDEAWALTTWTPKDDIVPNKAILFVDGDKKDEKTFTLDADEWAALPGTALPSSGSIERAVITHDNRILKNAVSVDLKNVNFESSVQVQLYSGKTLLTTATLQGVTPGSYRFLTCCIPTETADKYWALTPWTPKDDVVPNKVVLFVDGNKKDEKTFELNADEWAALPGTVLPSSGTIVIVPDRTEDTTPKTENQKNPSTGANDMVAAAVAIMAVSALGAVVLTRKK
ncbi:MAG: LPXTG cell wall anchor domain-containing protein [Angelakisella sp.]